MLGLKMKAIIMGVSVQLGLAFAMTHIFSLHGNNHIITRISLAFMTLFIHFLAGYVAAANVENSEIKNAFTVGVICVLAICCLRPHMIDLKAILGIPVELGIYALGGYACMRVKKRFRPVSNDS